MIQLAHLPVIRGLTKDGKERRWQTAASEQNFRAKDTAAYIGVSLSTLAKWRTSGVGPRFHRCGPRIVYYLGHEIDEWLEECDAADPRRLPDKA